MYTHNVHTTTCAAKCMHDGQGAKHLVYSSIFHSI